ncbi:MAG: DUF2516 family protein [Tannerellaceae bacterium]|nr:DUF2516 family protein [Tannerellaceae bacterium]
MECIYKCFSGRNIQKVGSTFKTTTASTEEYQKALGELKSTFSGVGKMAIGLINPTALFQQAMSSVSNFLKGSKAAWEAQSKAEEKLSLKMQKTTQSSAEEIDAIRKVTSAQEKMGVISKNIQTAGATELAGYIQKGEHIKSLIPLMNDLIAKEHGLSASQSDATSMAQLMGNALKGEVQGLEACGVKLNEAQKEVLKYGEESEKVAILSEAMKTSIGGVNEALAATPEGKMQKHTHAMKSLQARIGSLYEKVMISLMPLFDTVSKKIDVIVSLFETHQGKIVAVVNTVANICSVGFDMITGVIASAVSGVAWLYEVIESGFPILVGLAGILAVVAQNLIITSIQLGMATLKTMLFNTWTMIISKSKLVWTAIQAGLNLVMSLSPFGMLMVGIIGVVAAISFLRKNFESVEVFFQNSFDKIIIGWLKFKKMLGLGNKEEHQAEIDKLNANIDNRKKQLEENANNQEQPPAETPEKVGSIGGYTLPVFGIGEQSTAGGYSQETPYIPTAQDYGFTGIEETNLSTTTTKFTQQESFLNNDSQGINNPETSHMVSSISAGGNTGKSITINLGSMIENLIFNGEFETNREDMQKEVENALMNVLQMAYSAQ